MNQQYTRREVLAQAGMVGLSTVGLFTVGCSEQKAKTTAATHPVEQPEKKEMAYAESDQFFDDFRNSIEQGHTVVVTFDGKHKLGKQSKLFQLLADEKVTDKARLIASIRDLDTKQGRDSLGTIFEDGLLEHETLKQELTLPSGEVVAPGIFLLVLVIVMTSAAFASEIIQGRRIKAIVLPFGARIEFEPLAQ